MRIKRRRRPKKHASAYIALSAIICAALLCIVLFSAVLYAIQDHVLFNAVSLNTQNLNILKEANPYTEDLSILTNDGVELHGWLVKSPVLKKAPLVIYFGGNSEEVSHMIENADLFGGCAVAFVNYRGYGNNAGTPSEDSLFSDALQIYDTLSQRSDIDSAHIVSMGYSLGSGVAVYVAENRPVSGVILSAPYQSIIQLTQEKLPLLPVKYILKYSFDSYNRAPLIDAPLLTLAAENDKVIPINQSKKLTENWGGYSCFVSIPNTTHATLAINDAYWEHIQTFLDLLSSKQ